ncbi:ty3-gypsy retrotransposon protein [Cucumis melo var. makuwa]|uniref:Ty3-gypsy retrotransposon protein n=1 Tax=Cucumis melo var. makuwa TaxID=1194695 RepID=A0A5A7SV24_CUCMM|nr:ty3-gypsy retrotransposon protein [Cucumis melo var. makuwa]
MLVRFRATREGTLVGRFLTIKQKTTVEEYRNRFDKLLAPVAFLPTMVLEETFMNGLNPWLKSEVETLEPNGLAQMMKLALKIENRELVRKEYALISAYDTKTTYKSQQPKNVGSVAAKEGTIGGSWPMRTITLREVATGDNRREGPTKRLTDVEFQARREKGLCFRCGEKYYARHRCKSKENKELRMLLVKEGGEELEIVEEEFFDAETEMKQVEVQNVENLNIELSINSETSNYGVILGSGTAVKVGGVDMILGMQWLHSLRGDGSRLEEVTVDFLPPGQEDHDKGRPESHPNTGEFEESGEVMGGRRPGISCGMSNHRLQADGGICTRKRTGGGSRGPHSLLV